MGAKCGKEAHAIAKSRGGNGTKIHALVDALGYPIEILLTGANVHDSVPAADFIRGKKSQYFLGDKVYDSNPIREAVQYNRSQAVIPSHGRKFHVFQFDRHIYKERHLVECFFQKIKSWRRIATRYEKIIQMLQGMVHIACILVWLLF